MNPPTPLPELYYAMDIDGAKLPIIDITHPAFAIRLSSPELQKLEADHRRDEQRRAKLPRWMQRAVYWYFVRRSGFGRRMRQATGGFLDGMSTYRLKLGPGHLDPSWATPIDRKIAASFGALCMRLRLQDMAELLADHLAPRLETTPGRPVHLINIAGGPCMDSLNALVLLQRRDARLLRSRTVRIDVLDQDHGGPAFAAQALAQLKQPAAPLAGVDVTLEHVPYRWDDPAPLQDWLARLPRDIVAAASSEGGLFDYGTDAEIAANLDVLREGLPADAAVAGSLTPPKPAGTPPPVGPSFNIRKRELSEFSRVVTRTQWQLTRTIVRPFQTTVLLTRGAEMPR